MYIYGNRKAIFMDYIKKVIVYTGIIFFIFVIGANTGGNLYSRDKFIMKRKKYIGASLKDIVIDLIWIISSLAAGIIAIVFYPDERFKLIILMLLCEIAFTIAIIKDIKSYSKKKKL